VKQTKTNVLLAVFGVYVLMSAVSAETTRKYWKIWLFVNVFSGTNLADNRSLLQCNETVCQL